jgi:hypothetical protein
MHAFQTQTANSLKVEARGVLRGRRKQETSRNRRLSARRQIRKQIQHPIASLPRADASGREIALANRSAIAIKSLFAQLLQSPGREGGEGAASLIGRLMSRHLMSLTQNKRLQQTIQVTRGTICALARALLKQRAATRRIRILCE